MSHRFVARSLGSSAGFPKLSVQHVPAQAGGSLVEVVPVGLHAVQHHLVGLSMNRLLDGREDLPPWMREPLAKRARHESGCSPAGSSTDLSLAGFPSLGDGAALQDGRAHRPLP